MGSDEYYGLYDDEIDMNYSTYSKPKRNTQPIQLKQKKNGKNKKKAKSSGSIEKAAVAPSTSKIKDSALKPDTTESETNKKTMQLGLFPVEIMDLILEELWDDDRKGFMNLSYTSKSLRLNSERILFRTLVISDKAPWVRRVTTSVLERLVDEDDCNLWKCIRHIEVGPITDADWFYEIAYPSLCQILGNLKNLQSLTWATPLSTTPAHAHAQTKQPSILEALQTWHPCAKLKFVCHNRDFHGELMPIDEALLSSPQLHTLDATLSLIQDGTHPPDYEVQLLKESLIHGASIKVLRFNIQDPSNHHLVFTPSPPVSFTWHPTDSFPPLEELSLPQARPKYHSAYNLNRDGLLMWARAMDWTHMRRLDFHHHNPSLFFATFTDRVPNLKYLRWGLLPSQDGSGWNRTPTCASAFMRSVTALEEVVFNGGWGEFNDFVYGILEILNAQGRNLKRLTVECSSSNAEGFSIAQYWDIFERAPGLQYLRVARSGAFLEGSWEEKDSRLAPGEKWKGCRWNKGALKVGRERKNEAHIIWVPGRREPGILLGPVTRNYFNPRVHEGDQDFFG